MNSFWVKMAIFAAIVVGLVLLVRNVSKSTVKHIEETKGIGQMWEEDDQRLRAEPPPKQQEPKAAEETAVAEQKTAVEQVAAEPQPQFRELDDIEKADADKLFEVAIQHRKMGRIGGIGFKLMVDCCRQLIEKYPDSVYAYNAKRMIAEVPKRHWKKYGITEEEVKMD